MDSTLNDDVSVISAGVQNCRVLSSGAIEDWCVSAGSRFSNRAIPSLESCSALTHHRPKTPA